MRWLLTLPVAIWRRLLLIGQGVLALLVLIGTGIGALFGGGGTLADRLKAKLTAPASLRRGMAVLRLFQPNLLLGTKLITCYANEGTAFVTRRHDRLGVLSRGDDFGGVFGPRVGMITGGGEFLP